MKRSRWAFGAWTRHAWFVPVLLGGYWLVLGLDAAELVLPALALAAAGLFAWQRLARTRRRHAILDEYAERQVAQLARAKQLLSEVRPKHPRNLSTAT